MDILVRDMREEDREEVFEMMRAFYNTDAVFHTSSDAVLNRDINDCLSDMPFLDGFVFEVSGKVAGYAMTALNYTTEYGGLSLWIEDLYIKEEYRGLGISRLFFNHIEEKYTNIVRFKLEVEPENEHAIDVYKRNGYHVSPYFEMTKEMIED